MIIDVLIGEVIRLSFCYGAKSSHLYVYTLNQVNKETKVQISRGGFIYDY